MPSDGTTHSTSATSSALCRVELRSRPQGSFHVREWYEAAVTPPAGPPYVMLFSREIVRRRLGREDRKVRKARRAALESLCAQLESLGWQLLLPRSDGPSTAIRPLVFRAAPSIQARRTPSDQQDGAPGATPVPATEDEQPTALYTLGSRLDMLSTLIAEVSTARRERTRAGAGIIGEARLEAESIRAAALEQAAETQRQALREGERFTELLRAAECRLAERAAALDSRDGQVHERELAIAAGEQRNIDESRWLKRYARQVEEIISSLNQVASDAPRQIGSGRTREDSA